MLNNISKRQTAVQKYLDIIDNKTNDTVKFNIFFVFSRASSWFTFPIEKRVVDSYMLIELKKMIEYYALAESLLKNESEYEAMIKKTFDNLNFTWFKKLETVMSVEQIKKGLSKYGGDPSMIDSQYSVVNFSGFIDKYAPEYYEIYKKMNYIQHKSLIPSSRMNAMRNDVFEASSSLIINMHKNLIKTFSIKGEELKELNESFQVITRFM